MKETTIAKLNRHGVTLQQIQQLVKIQEAGVHEDIIIDGYTLYKLCEIDTDEYRKFRQTLTCTDLNANLLFDAFINNRFAYLNIAEKVKDKDNLLYIYDNKDKVDAAGIDLLCNVDKRFEIRDVLLDIIDGVDVAKYIYCDFSKNKANLLRNGLKNGIDITDYIVKFSWICEDDFDNLKVIINENLDADAALKKMKDSSKALFIATKKKEGIDVLPYVNKNMSIEAMGKISEKISEGKIDFVKKIKTFSISKAGMVDLLEQINESYFPIKECKDYSVDTLKDILTVVNAKMSVDEIREMLCMPIFGELRDIYIKCYMENKPEYLDFIKENISQLTYIGVSAHGRLLELFEYCIKNNLDVLKVIIQNDGQFIDESKYKTISQNIINGKIDNKLIDILNDRKYDEEKSEFVIKAYEEGYDVSLFTPDLRSNDMEAILNCLRLGIEMKKPEKYNTEKTVYGSRIRDLNDLTYYLNDRNYSVYYSYK